MRQCFVNANNLLTPKFLLAPIFCVFTGAYIFVNFASAYIFVCANNLLAPIF
jgi:hypothetical protein